MIQYDYNNELFENPIPSIEIELRTPLQDDASARRVLMVLDSGADMTCLPKRALSAIGKLSTGTRTVIDYEGLSHEAITRFVDLVFDGVRMKNLEVVEIPQDFGFIGRDVLNRHKIVMDGPSCVWYREEDPPKTCGKKSRAK